MIKTRDVVLKILQEEELARSNDNYLILRVYETLGLPTDLRDIARTSTNKFESIRRWRAKLQEINPYLRPRVQTSRRRKAMEEKYREEMRV